jgi:hypothetical protein
MNPPDNATVLCAAGRAGYRPPEGRGILFSRKSIRQRIKAVIAAGTGQRHCLPRRIILPET